MNRRSLLGSILFGAASTRVSVPDDPFGMAVPVAASNIRASPSPPWRDALVRAMQREQELREARDQPTGCLPPHISAMRSWSPVYKAHVFAEEKTRHVPYRWHSMSEVELLAEAVKRGLDVS